MAEASSATQEIRLPQGVIRYRELGEGEPIVLVHGYLVDGGFGARPPSTSRPATAASSPIGRWAPIGLR